MKIGKISTIKKEFSPQFQTMGSELAKRGYFLFPGTSVRFLPYREITGVYRTGLDPNASYIKRIADQTAREIEMDKAQKLKVKLEEILELDLGPRSEYWNNARSTSPNDTTHVQPIKLVNGDNYFDLSNPAKELEFAWLRVHQSIASSYEAWLRGDYPSETKFYVVDDEVENLLLYSKKKLINDAIVKFDNMTPTKQLKIARQLGVPVSDYTKKEVVYNLVDNVLKQTEFKSGEHKGLDPVKVFHRFADMSDDILHVKDIVKQAIEHSVIRTKPSGKVLEGELELANTVDDYVKFLVDDNNQEELIELEQKLKGKKLQEL